MFKPIFSKIGLNIKILNNINMQLIKCIICDSHLTIYGNAHYETHENSKKHKYALEDINENINEYNEFLKKNPKSKKLKKYNELKKLLEYKLYKKYIE